MKYCFLVIIGALLSSCSQNEIKEKSLLKQASEYFPNEKTQTLVVGTFHFDYPGLDVYNAKDEDKIDVLTEPKKSEVTEVVEYIKKFRPTKIAIEAYDNWNAVEKLRAYNNGEYRDQRDERYQLAIRLASELKLDTIYSINAQSYDNDLMKLDSQYIEKLFQDFDFKNDDPYNELYKKWIEEDSKIRPQVHLLDYLKHINSKESHQYGFGVYLVGDFKLDNVRGADILSIWWYNRNLRIFRKIQQITENSNDRILVIIGNGHAEVLRQLIESSPEYEFIEFDGLKII